MGTVDIERRPIPEEKVDDDFVNTFCQSATLSDLRLDTFNNSDSQSRLEWMEKCAVRRPISGLSSLQHFAVCVLLLLTEFRSQQLARES